MFLVPDGSSLLVTNYFASMPNALKFEKDPMKQTELYSTLMHTSDNIYTNAVLGTLRMLLTILKDRPDITHMAIVFDKSRNTFRRELYPEYKAQRKPTAEPLKQQFITMETILKDLGFCVLFHDDFEADDLAGSVIKQFENDHKMAFLTKDHDYLQLINDNVEGWMLQTSEEKALEIMAKTNASTYNLPGKIALFNSAIVKQEEGVTPSQIVDKKALAGDASDNIPGVNGVGDKAIIPLLAHYSSIEKIYQDIDSKSEEELNAFWKETLGIARSPYKKLLTDRDTAFLSKKLATIKCDCPIPKDLSDYEIKITKEKLQKVIDRYELNSLQSFADNI